MSDSGAAPDDMGLFEVMFNCRSMRRLKTDPVAEELLVKLVECGNQAASGSNSQLARWIVVREPKVKAELAALNKAAVDEYLGPGSSRPRSLAHQSDAKRERMLNAVRWQAEHLQEIPALLIACCQFAGEQEVSETERYRAGGSIWPGVQNVLLAARALGLGATPTTLGLRDRAAVKRALRMLPNMEAYCLIPVGWPLGSTHMASPSASTNRRGVAGRNCPSTTCRFRSEPAVEERMHDHSLQASCCKGCRCTMKTKTTRCLKKNSRKCSNRWLSSRSLQLLETLISMVTKRSCAKSCWVILNAMQSAHRVASKSA